MKKQFMLCGALIFAVLPASAFAQEKFNVPEGCIAMATIHKTMCHTTTLLSCGAGYNTVTFQKGEPLVVANYTGDWELMAYRYADGQVAQFTAVPDLSLIHI